MHRDVCDFGKRETPASTIGPFGLSGRLAFDASCAAFGTRAGISFFREWVDITWLRFSVKQGSWSCLRELRDLVVSSSLGRVSGIQKGL